VVIADSDHSVTRLIHDRRVEHVDLEGDGLGEGTEPNLRSKSGKREVERATVGLDDAAVDEPLANEPGRHPGRLGDASRRGWDFRPCNSPVAGLTIGTAVRSQARRWTENVDSIDVQVGEIDAGHA
jgi:hypothetical protein